MVQLGSVCPAVTPGQMMNYNVTDTERRLNIITITAEGTRRGEQLPFISLPKLDKDAMKDTRDQQ